MASRPLNMVWKPTLVAVLLVPVVGGWPAQAVAQEWTVTRRAYTPISDHVVIEVDCNAAGDVRIAVGALGRLAVMGRARHGVTESGLTGSASDRLFLTEMGADSVEFLVFVPEDVRTLVRLPGPSFPVGVSPKEGTVLSWPARGRVRKP